MKKTLFAFWAVLAGVILTLPLAEAHHGWAEFNLDLEMTLEGTVTDFHFTNPHCVVEFAVKDEKGTTRKWQGEFASPVELTRKGWTAASLQPGDKMSITGHPARDGGPELYVTGIRLADGRQLQIARGR